jgi:SAM-dependent methyltransferase
MSRLYDRLKAVYFHLSNQRGLMKNILEFPAEFDAEHYRSRYPDLGITSDAQAEAHFRDHGLAAGLEGSPLVLREAFLKEMVGREEGNALEIGPFCSPILRGPHVAYLDAFDATELRSRAKQHGLDPELCPDTIDFVGDLADVDRTFQYVLSSHTIEHSPDLVHHLKSVSELLESGGRYYLMIPDKRFCFDALKAQSTIADVLQAHKEKRTRHTLASVIEYNLFSTHNNPSLHWQGISDPSFSGELAQGIKFWMDAFDKAGDDYIDTHAWYFTPTSFRSIASTLFELGLTGLNPIRVYNTPRDRFEFCAILEKSVPRSAGEAR